jgi:hypothetical protein
VKALVAIAKLLGPEGLAALIDLARMAINGSSKETIAEQAGKLAHVVAFEKGLKAARAKG